MKGKLCICDADLQRSITFQRDIEVWFKGELSEVGILDSFTDDSVKMKNGSYFLRMNCQFLMN